MTTGAKPTKLGFGPNSNQSGWIRPPRNCHGVPMRAGFHTVQVLYASAWMCKPRTRLQWGTWWYGGRLEPPTDPQHTWGLPCDTVTHKVMLHQGSSLWDETLDGDTCQLVVSISEFGASRGDQSRNPFYFEDFAVGLVWTVVVFRHAEGDFPLGKKRLQLHSIGHRCPQEHDPAILLW